MYVINGGIPRSGTVLVGEILRGLLHRRGYNVLRVNPQERRHLPEFAQHIAEAEGRPAVLAHTHLVNSDCLEALARRDDGVVFWNHRDPRDALVSLIRLHDMSLEQGLHSMEVYLTAADIARTADGVRAIRYERLVADTPRHIRRIAEVLGFEIDDAEVSALAEATSPARHAQIMQTVRAAASDRITTVKTLMREMREDPQTLINDRHLQSGRPGRWRDELSPEAQELVNERLSTWINAYGYEL